MIFFAFFEKEKFCFRLQSEIFSCFIFAKGSSLFYQKNIKNDEDYFTFISIIWFAFCIV
jgi:hypothetical protein